MQKDKLHIFIIPSWFPTEEAPLAGSFFMEQAEALAELRPDWTITLCMRHHGDCSLLPHNPMRVLRNARRLLKHEQVEILKRGNINEIHLYKAHLLPHNLHAPLAGKHLKQVMQALEDTKDIIPPVDIIHAHVSFPGGTVGARLAKKMNVPFILSEHMGPFPWECHLRNGEPVSEIKEAFEYANIVTAPSNSLAADIRKYKLSENITVVANSFAPFFKPQEKLSGDTFNFISIGWPSQNKGTDILLKAFAEVKKTSKVQLTIVGNSPEIESYKKTAQDLGISEKTTWLGNVERSEIPALLNSSDCFVMPSVYETFGVSLIEALACGKPVISTSSGGPNDIVTNDNGYLVPVNDAFELELAMKKMLKNYHLFDQQKISASATEKYSSKEIAKRFSELYLELSS